VHTLHDVERRFAPLKGGVALYPLSDPADIDGGGGDGSSSTGRGSLVPGGSGGSGVNGINGGGGGGGGAAVVAPVPGVPLAVDPACIAPYRAALATAADDCRRESAAHMTSLSSVSDALVRLGVRADDDNKFTHLSLDAAAQMHAELETAVEARHEAFANEAQRADAAAARANTLATAAQACVGLARDVVRRVRAAHGELPAVLEEIKAAWGGGAALDAALARADDLAREYRSNPLGGGGGIGRAAH